MHNLRSTAKQVISIEKKAVNKKQKENTNKSQKQTQEHYKKKMHKCINTQRKKPYITAETSKP